MLFAEMHVYPYERRPLYQVISRLSLVQQRDSLQRRMTMQAVGNKRDQRLDVSAIFPSQRRRHTGPTRARHVRPETIDKDETVDKDGTVER